MLNSGLMRTSEKKTKKGFDEKDSAALHFSELQVVTMRTFYKFCNARRNELHQKFFLDNSL